jgi:hypothetical protein
LGICHISGSSGDFLRNSSNSAYSDSSSDELVDNTGLGPNNKPNPDTLVLVVDEDGASPIIIVSARVMLVAGSTIAGTTAISSGIIIGIGVISGILDSSGIIFPDAKFPEASSGDVDDDFTALAVPTVFFVLLVFDGVVVCVSSISTVVFDLAELS